jgi:hypothetical protein
MNIQSKVNIKEGSIALRVKEKKLIWNDGTEQMLFNISKSDGNVFLVKNSDNKLKFSHVFLGKGEASVEVDVSELPIDEPHHIAVTWNIEKEIVLYIDGKLRDKSDIWK